jgi:DNA (cytosine-5)-methyltransferase 1
MNQCCAELRQYFKGAGVSINQIKYLSLFSGIGGFELGIGDKGECIGYSEIDKYAVRIYRRHFPEHKGFGDITKIDPKSLPDFDLVVGGFPCQSFSVAGKGKGFQDQRGTLFFEIVRIVREKRPRLLLFENVRGLLSNDGGRTFFTILASLDALGYDLQWQVLNSKNFRVPQGRPRVFIIGHLRGTRRPEVFPLEGDGKADNVIPTLTARYYGAQSTGAYLRQISPKGRAQAERVYDPKGIATTLASTDGGLGAATGLYMMQRPRGNNKGGVKAKNGIAPALSSSSYEHNNYLVTKSRYRRLTPTECERIQGFPDGWTEGISDRQRYRRLGKAVTVNVIKAIIDKLF